MSPFFATSPKALPHQEIITAFREIAEYVSAQHVQRVILQIEPSNEDNQGLRRAAFERAHSIEYADKSVGSYHPDFLLDPREKLNWEGKNLASETKGYQALAVIIVGSKDIGGEETFLDVAKTLKSSASDVLPAGTVAFEVTIRVPCEQRFLPQMKAGTYETVRILIDANDFKNVSDMAKMQLENGTSASELKRAFEIGLQNYRDNLGVNMAIEKPAAVSVNDLLSGLSLPGHLLRV